jgi:hypothetical protein
MEISVVVSPPYPFRGGIAHHTTLMMRHLRKRYDVQFISLKSLYPHWMFSARPIEPGCTQKSNSLVPTLLTHPTTTPYGIQT